jgi:hypothetical protein
MRDAYLRTLLLHSYYYEGEATAGKLRAKHKNYRH